jgi:hypothetical protein
MRTRHRAAADLLFACASIKTLIPAQSCKVYFLTGLYVRREGACARHLRRRYGEFPPARIFDKISFHSIFAFAGR